PSTLSHPTLFLADFRASDDAPENASDDAEQPAEPAIRPGIRRPTADEIALQQARENAGLGEEQAETTTVESSQTTQLPPIPARTEQLELDGDVTYTLPGIEMLPQGPPAKERSEVN